MNISLAVSRVESGNDNDLNEISFELRNVVVHVYRRVIN